LNVLGSVKLEAVVETVTLEVIAVGPLGVTEPGEKLQLTPGGGELQASATAWLNPPVGVTVTV